MVDQNSHDSKDAEPIIYILGFGKLNIRSAFLIQVRTSLATKVRHISDLLKLEILDMSSTHDPDTGTNVDDQGACCLPGFTFPQD